MHKQVKRSYEFSPFRINVTRRVLLRDGEPVQLTPKAFDILLILVENNGRVIEKDELINLIWPGTFVEEGNLAVHIYTLRKVLGTTPDGRQYIETVPRRGYKFFADVKETVADEANLVLTEHISSTIEFDGQASGEAGAIEQELAEGGIIRNVSATIRTESSRHKSIADWTNAIAGRKIYALLVAAVAGIALLAVAFYLFKPVRTPPRSPFHEMKISKVTSLGTVQWAAISPDGKYVAYVCDGEHDGGLWIKHLPTGSTARINEDIEIQYLGLIFSPDSNYIYYRALEKENSLISVYRMPVLGGVSTKIIEGADSYIAVSSEGSRLAFVRYSRQRKESALIVANADGSGQQTLATRKDTEVILGDPSGPAWSPDGKAIAYFFGTRGNDWARMNLIEIRPEDRVEKIIASGEWRWLSNICWLSDGRGLLFTASESDIFSQQIWHVSYPEGELRRITNDLNGYMNISLTADSNTLVCSQIDQFSSLSIMRESEAGRAKQITSGTRDGSTGLSWTPDGRIVYPSEAGGNSDIWIMDVDGRNRKQLTNDPAEDRAPTITRDGKYIVFTSSRSGRFQIWRMDLDGGNPIQLTSENWNHDPECSPDGKWVIYISWVSNKPTLWRVPIDGGDPVQVIDRYCLKPAVSPDGKFIACKYLENEGSGKLKVAVFPFEGGEPVRTFDNSFLIRWTPDGRALTLLPIDFSSNSTIRLQPIDGSPAKELASFKDNQIWAFDWSPDGKQLACALGKMTRDVVLISNSDAGPAR